MSRSPLRLHSSAGVPPRCRPRARELGSGIHRMVDSSRRPWCEVTSYKLAAECGTADYMVLTLFCSNDQYNASYPVFTSRVLLIRRAPFAYWDLTTLVEEELGMPMGSVQGIYATCGAASDGPVPSFESPRGSP